MSIIGKRDRQIILQAPAAVTVNRYNEEAPASFDNVATEWAQVIYPSPGQELTQAAQLVAVQPVQFIIRYRADVRPTWQIEFDGQVYRITAVTEIGRRRGLTITAQGRGVEAGTTGYGEGYGDSY